MYETNDSTRELNPNILTLPTAINVEWHAKPHINATLITTQTKLIKKKHRTCDGPTKILLKWLLQNITSNLTQRVLEKHAPSTLPRMVQKGHYNIEV